MDRQSPVDLPAEQESEKLPWSLRAAIIVGGALVGWAVPIALVSRFL